MEEKAAMTARVVILLTAWWFLHVSNGAYNRGTATVVGPFMSETDCQQITAWVEKRGDHASSCWRG